MKHTVLSLIFLGIVLHFSGCRAPAYDEPAERATPPTATQIVPDPPRKELDELEERLNTTDLGIEMIAQPDPARFHESLAYTLTVTNNGPNPASETQVVNRFPDGVAYLSSTAECRESSSRVLTCEIGELLARSSVTITIEAIVEEDAPMTVRNIATVHNLAGPDPNPENDTAAIDVQIVQ